MKNKFYYVLISLICLSLALLSCLMTNMHNIYAKQADYYFKNNNIKKAQILYEKAFELGLNDTEHRNFYINTIINSPLTIDAQEKLLKFIESSQDDSAKLKAEYFINDLKKEIHRKYPNNFITNAVFNQQIIRWGNLPITYSFDNKDNLPPHYIKEIENAFLEWEKNLDQNLYFEENNDMPNIIIKFDENNPANPDVKRYVVAYTSPIIQLNELKNMEMVFYLKDPMDNYFTENQVYNTALHEIAHALGFMGHSNDKNNIMYLSKDSIVEFNDIRECLTEADINTIKLLYKIKPDICNVKNVKGEYLPNLVLGSKSDINNKKLEEAKLYVKKAPELPVGYINLAEEYVAIKDYQKALKSLNKALKLADTNELKEMIYFNLAVTNFYLDSLEEAKICLQKSMQLKDSEEKHYLLGEIYLSEGKTKEAVLEYTNLLEKNPDNIEYVIALTNIYIVNRDYLRARSVLKKYFTNNPSERTNPRFKPYGILLKGL